MSRREIVVLVSRALAIVQFAYAFLDIAYLPMPLMEMIHYVREIGMTNDPAFAMYYSHYYQADSISLIVRITGMLVCGIVLWNCGPWVESKLLPAKQEAQESAEPSA